MKNIILFLLSILLLSSCAVIKIKTPEGLEAKYTRWGDQEIQGLEVVLPEGVAVKLDGSNSQAEALTEAIRLIGALTASVPVQ